MTHRINRTLEWLWHAGLASRPSLSPADILSKAERRTRVSSNILPAEWLKRLDLLTNDLEAHASLTALGRTIAHGQLVSAAANMMRFETLWRTHPEIDEMPMTSPMLIVGQMRSGTTRMQRLLACDDRFHFTRFYESWNPLPRSSLPAFDDRPWRARAALAAARWINPGFDAIHPTSAASPDEEIGLLNILMHSASYEAQWHVPNFVAHCEAMDTRPLYRDFGKMMKTIAWLRRRTDDQPWVMKIPQFTQDLASLLATFPDARVVKLERDDRDVLSSSVRLVRNQRAIQSTIADPQVIETEWRRKIALRARRTSDALIRIKPLRIDVRFADMDSNWEHEIERVYGRFDIALTDRVREAMRRYIARAAVEGFHKAQVPEGESRQRLPRSLLRLST